MLEETLEIRKIWDMNSEQSLRMHQAFGEMMATDFSVPCALVIGAEDRGVSRSLLQVVDKTFLIPQVGKSDSLNVSVACGAFLYEIVRQRL